MLCTIFRAASMPTVPSAPQPNVLPTSSETRQESIAQPVVEQLQESVSPTDVQLPEVTSSPSSTSQLFTTPPPTLNSEPSWLISQDLDEHIDSFLSLKDRARFSRINHNYHHEMNVLSRRRLKLEYQSDPHPLRAFQSPEKRLEIRYPTDKAGTLYAQELLGDRPFLMRKYREGYCNLQQAMDFLKNNTDRLDKFLNSEGVSDDVLIRVKNCRRLIECGVLSIIECAEATGDKSTEQSQSHLFESYFAWGLIDKQRFLELTSDQARMLAEPLVQQLIFANRRITANEALDIEPTELERLKDELLAFHRTRYWERAY